MNEMEQYLKNHFISMEGGKMLAINGMQPSCPAWIIKNDGKIGVAIPYEGKKKFYGAFAKAELELIDSPKGDGYWLYLNTKVGQEKASILQFATVCNDFIRTGDDGHIRREIAAHPEKWWNSWRSLLGNAAHDQMVHAVVGEMLVWLYLIQYGYRPKWTGSKRKCLDFVDGCEAWEVKSTLSRTELKVTVHGQYQLAKNQGEALKLIFCRMEESDLGESVNKLAEKLKKAGIDGWYLENELKALGLREGSIARDRRFRLLEARAYQVDENFPAITESSFVGGCLPAGIVQLDYTIDLANLPFFILNIV